MSDSESVDYLQTGFDPKSLTVPRLRSILVTHDIQYPSTAKKPQLIELFNDQVVPLSKKYLAARARAKRTSQGIFDADSQSTTSTDFEHDLKPPPRTTTRSRSPRKTTKVKSEYEEPAPIRESPRKRVSRSVSAQPQHATDDESAHEVESAKTPRRRHATPAAVKLEAPEEPAFFRRTPETEAVFSNDNPFQSGSSPASATKTPTNRKTFAADAFSTDNPFQSASKTPADRRKTTGLDPVKVKSTPATSRRRTDVHAFDSREPTVVSKSFEMPISSLNRPTTPKFAPSNIEAGEEFTPDEQLALMQEEQANPQLAAARRKQSRSSRGSSVTTPLWVLVITLLGAYAAWYRQEKIAVGYCGLGRDSSQLIPSHIQIPEWAQEYASKLGIYEIKTPEWIVPFVEPECETCPSHAYCYEDFTVRCEEDFILKPHPLSLGGLVPLPPTCEPDGEKVRRVQAIADRAVEELRDRRAAYECGEPTEPEGLPLDTPAIGEQELKETLSKKRSKRLGADEFDQLWAAAIGEVKDRDEVLVEVVEEQTGGTPGFPTTRLSSSSLARLSYTCAAQRAIRLGLARHRLSIGGVIFSLLLLVYGRRQFIANRAMNAKVPGLVDEVLSRLATQKELAFDEENDDAFLFLPNLRDDLLRSMHRFRERERLWLRVKALVEQNSNVRTGIREGKNGEIGRAWEWIGPARPGIEGSARRRRSDRASARVSFGPDVKEEKELEAAAQDGAVGGRTSSYRKWEESRPIY
ncbi:Man1-Src1p-C-terminal domain-containing protein [Cercophora scortea]|uniref:Man1-Src1p-C-terminal domain-containing protein n=1 Tax=Cercophora scortea TaxID=314031 RepID=A0AAE0J6E0_9PEZI|nr:Man1-Src1p-C-terminal domain-containing protein [Cercophora scortea]